LAFLHFNRGRIADIVDLNGSDSATKGRLVVGGVDFDEGGLVRLPTDAGKVAWQKYGEPYSPRDELWGFLCHPFTC